MEKKKLCSLMDCQKLSREAFAQAAQNDRLPVQTVVQLLYYEKQNLREILSDADSSEAANAAEIIPSPELRSYNNEFSKLNRENQDLKLELLKVKMKFNELENEKVFEVMNGSDCSSPVSSASVVKPRLPRTSFISSVCRRLGKLNPFGLTQGRTIKPAKGRSRRHSIS